MATDHRARPMVTMALTQPTPYRSPIIDRLLQSSALSLRVVYLTRGDSRRPWIDQDSEKPGIRFIASRPSGRPMSNWYCPVGLISELVRGKSDLVYIGGYTPLGMVVAGLICYLRGIPFGWICESHLAKRRSWVRRAAKAILLKTVISTARASLAVSSPAKRYLVHYGAKEESVFIFPNTCDVEGIGQAVVKARQRIGQLQARFGTSDHRVLLYVGRLSPEKNVELLLRAWKAVEQALPSALLLLVGDGPEAETLKDLGRSLELARLRWIGWGPSQVRSLRRLPFQIVSCCRPAMSRSELSSRRQWVQGCRRSYLAKWVRRRDFDCGRPNRKRF